MKYYSGIQRPTAVAMRGWLLVAMLACLTPLLSVSQALICYRCTVLPPQYMGDPDQQCSKFDHSEKFYVECPASTFCMKRIITHEFTKGNTVTTFERNCASQKNVSQVYKDKQWHKEQNIETDIYNNGCFKIENKGTINGFTEYCYCSRNYCNDSTVINPQHYISLLVFTVLLMLNFT